MQISWVLSEQERDRRFNKLKKITYRNNLIPPMKQEQGNPEVAVHPVSLLKTPEIQFTLEEQLRIENWKNFILSMRKEKYTHFFTCEQVCISIWKYSKLLHSEY